MGYANVAVWIDQHEARVIGFPCDFPEGRLEFEPERRVVRRAQPAEFGAGPLEYDFLESVKLALSDAGSILIAGPGSAKVELVAHIRQHDQAMGRRIAGVEPLDRPGNGKLVALARRLFSTRRYVSP